jgi:hypothetical protein
MQPHGPFLPELGWIHADLETTTAIDHMLHEMPGCTNDRAPLCLPLTALSGAPTSPSGTLLLPTARVP